MEEAMVLYRARFVQQLLGPVHEASAESCPGTIGHITLDAKQTGTRSAGNPHAACDEAGIGNGFTVRILRHSQRKQGAPARLELRSTAPVLDPTLERVLETTASFEARSAPRLYSTVTMVAGLRSVAKAMELPPEPNVRAPALDPTDERDGEQEYGPDNEAPADERAGNG